MTLRIPLFIKNLTDNPIRAFALLCVAATSVFFGYLALELINILKSPDWCGKALQAERITAGATFVGLTACVDLLKMQLGALAQTLIIVIGTFALCLGVLVVIVIAGARLVGKILGQDINVERQSDMPAAQAATQVAAAAVDEASAIAGEEK